MNKSYDILHTGKQILLAVTFQKKRRDKINNANRARLKNTCPTLVCSNCVGGWVYHDLGLQFRSQFINLFLFSRDFVKYLNNFDYYNSIDEIRFLPDDERDTTYPVGFVDDIRVYFVHYKSNEQAQKAWNDRKKRIDKDNMFVIMSEQDGCSREDIEAFSRLPYKNKVVFTKKPYPDIPCACYIDGFEKTNIGIFAFRSQVSARRYIDDFPLVDWFNGDFRFGE